MLLSVSVFVLVLFESLVFVCVLLSVFVFVLVVVLLERLLSVSVLVLLVVLFERLLSGAKSIVRIRKTGHPADEESLEATIARMETALKENRLGEVLAQAKRLPPKAALAGEDWLSRVEMRYTVEQALAETEAALKSSLAPNPAGTDRRQ